jgi:predicted Fe-Mo cluster-binding NifX family protein
MRVAVASDDGKKIARHFGRTRGFLVYDVERSEIRSRRYRKNTFTGHAKDVEPEGDSVDCHSAIIAALKDCEAVISHGMGIRIYEDLRNAGIIAYVVDETDADAALSLYLRNALTDHPEKGCGRGA